MENVLILQSRKQYKCRSRETESGKGAFFAGNVSNLQLTSCVMGLGILFPGSLHLNSLERMMGAGEKWDGSSKVFISTVFIYLSPEDA